MSQFVIGGLVTEMSVGDGIVSWTATRNTSDSNDTIDAQGVASATKTASEFPPPDFVWKITRSAMQFDTSILSGQTILSVVMQLFLRANETSNPRDATVVIVDGGTIPGPYPFQTSDYSKVGSTSYGSYHLGTGTFPEGEWIEIALDASVIPTLNLSGNTILCAREIHDQDDDEPDAEPEGTAVHRFFYFQDDDSTCCRLIVTVQDAVPPEPPAPPTGPIDKTLYLDWTGSAPSATHNWCPNWTTPATSMALSRRSDGSLAVLFGTCDGTGRILRLDSSLHNDDGQAIDSFYQTAFGGGPSGRNSFQYLTTSVKGQGTLNMTAIKPDQVTEVGLRDRGLEDEPLGDQEWSGLRVNGERIAWRFGTSALDAWWKMRKLVAYVVPSAWSRTRGN